MFDKLRLKVIERQITKFLDTVEHNLDKYNFKTYSTELIALLNKVDSLGEDVDISESLNNRISNVNDLVSIRSINFHAMLGIEDDNSEPPLSTDTAIERIICLLRQSAKAFDSDDENTGHSLMVKASDLKFSLHEQFEEREDYLSAYNGMHNSQTQFYRRKTQAMHFPSTPFSLIDDTKSTAKNTAYGLLLLIYVNNLPYNNGMVELPNYWKRSYQLNTEDMIQTMLDENFLCVENGRLIQTDAGKDLAHKWFWLKKVSIAPEEAYKLIRIYPKVPEEKLNETLPNSKMTVYDALIDIHMAMQIAARKRGDPYDMDEFKSRAAEKVRRDLGMSMSMIYWPSESKTYSIIRSLYPKEKILRRCRPEWLQGLEIDIFLPDLKLGIEYQGLQHYKPAEHFGGEKTFRQVQMRDEKKRLLCRDNGVTLVYINYDDALTEELIKGRIDEAIQRDTK